MCDLGGGMRSSGSFVLRALMSAMVSFANETGIEIVAEGVETADELNVLTALGVTTAQGYFLAQPMRLDIAARLL